MTAQKARLLRKRNYELAVTPPLLSPRGAKRRSGLRATGNETASPGEKAKLAVTPFPTFWAAKRRGISETTSLNEQTRLAVTRKETKLRPCSDRGEVTVTERRGKDDPQ
jgi:hypothetical protein